MTGVRSAALGYKKRVQVVSARPITFLLFLFLLPPGTSSTTGHRLGDDVTRPTMGEPAPRKIMEDDKAYRKKCKRLLRQLHKDDPAAANEQAQRATGATATATNLGIEGEAQPTHQTTATTGAGATARPTTEQDRIRMSSQESSTGVQSTSSEESEDSSKERPGMNRSKGQAGNQRATSKQGTASINTSMKRVSTAKSPDSDENQANHVMKKTRHDQEIEVENDMVFENDNDNTLAAEENND